MAGIESLSPEQRYFIQLLRDYVHRARSASPPEGTGWDKVAAYAKDQDLAGMVWYQSRDMPDICPRVRKRLKEGFFSDVYLSVNSGAALEEAGRRFSEAGIAYMPFKGSVIRDWYPHPEFRTMGDRDVLVHPEDRMGADRIMMDLGYEKMVDNQAVWTYFGPKLMFEVHDVMFYEDLANQVDYRAYFSRAWETAVQANTGMYVPELNLHFLYMTAHTAKHVTNKGMGFRAFLDMVFFRMNAKGPDGQGPDWGWIERELRRLRLYDFTCTCFTLCEAWFDVEMPFRLKDPDPAFIREVTAKMFRDGLFGLENEENRTAHSAKVIRKEGGPYLAAAFLTTVRLLFPPYDAMRLVPWYAWLDGRPWLLPFAWAYRWFYCLFHKTSRSRELLLEPYEKKEAIHQREEYLSRWGL